MNTAERRHVSEAGPVSFWVKVTAVIVACAVIGIFGWQLALNVFATPVPVQPWTERLAVITDDAQAQAVEAGYQVRAVRYLDGCNRCPTAMDVAFAVNNLMGSSALRVSSESPRVLLLGVTGQTEQAAREETARWQRAVESLLSVWESR